MSSANDGAKRRVEASRALDHVARLGMITYGVGHLAVAWLVVRLAFGDTSGAASGTGALLQLSSSPHGRLTLWVVATGFLALTVWQGIEAVFGYRSRDRSHRRTLRLMSVAKTVLFAIVLSRVTEQAAGWSGGGGTDGFTAKVLDWPSGQLLVGLVGIITIVVAALLGRFGWVENFRETMSHVGTTGVDGRVYVWLGKIGYVTRAVALGMVGALFGWAAVSDDARHSGGLDQALNDVVATPLGTPLLCLLAAGLVAYGLFCFAVARHLDR